MSGRRSDLFDDQVTPLKVGFWSQPNHWAALELGMSPDEAEALRLEYLLCLTGARDVLGRPCLCADVEKWPESVRGGANRRGDSAMSVVCLALDLKAAADVLPIRWKETHRVFIVQGRESEWWHSVGLAHRGLRFRTEDFMPDLGRQHAWAWMAFSLGWRGRCR